MDQTIGERLRQAREALRLSASEFAAALGNGCTKYSVYHWENGRSDVPDRYYAEIFKLGINPTWVLTGVGDMLESTAAQADARGNAKVVGHVMREVDNAGLSWTLDLINALGIQTKSNTEQLNDHEQRITSIESYIGELSPQWRKKNATP